FIERCFDVVYKYGGKDTEYIIKATDFQTAKYLSKYIRGYLMKQGKALDIKQDVQLANVEDINSIIILIDAFDKVALKTPLYSNYNLTIYSKKIMGEALECNLEKYANQTNMGFYLA
ncbi:MAG TPA: hypothetical protein VHP38_06175, partial [Ruminiclostridium sp.]|nr:hypothetical protein [Ruminiclostridium sp.]